jgi:hypothetical protein
MYLNRIQAEPAILLIPIAFSFFFGGKVASYSIPNWLLVLDYCGELFFNTCAIILISLHIQHGTISCGKMRSNAHRLEFVRGLILSKIRHISALHPPCRLPSKW